MAPLRVNVRRLREAIMAIDYTTPDGQVRLLISDVEEGDGQIFDDDQITGFLATNGDHVKRAAATALITIATSEVLISKVIKSQDLTTDGAKVADALRKNAEQLRREADDDEDREAGSFFDIVDFDPHRRGPELTGHGYL
jgi:Arc/MetJ family transcription regulator